MGLVPLDISVCNKIVSFKDRNSTMTATEKASPAGGGKCSISFLRDSRHFHFLLPFPLLIIASVPRFNGSG
jgi:hypothetical protein